MEKKVNKEEILEMLSDLSGPVGPEIFAGFGSILQKRIAEWNDDPSVILEKTDEFMNDWVKVNDSDETLRILLDILQNPPGREFYSDFYRRFKDNWDFILAELIIKLGRRNPEKYSGELKALIKDPSIGLQIMEILKEINSAG
jgi:hypothetical protein